jgi:ATP-dependent Clp protease adapter protein ClpS
MQAPLMQVVAPTKEVIKVPDTFVAPAGKTAGKAANAPKYRVLLFNDNANLREFVARAIVTSCPLDSGDAYHVMQGAHKNGFSLVGIFAQEVAEACHEGLQTKGIKSRLEPDSD